MRHHSPKRAAAVTCVALILAISLGPLAREEKLAAQTLWPAAQEEGHDVVTFAAGAIELAIPQRWIVTEVNAGREVRLYVTPQSLEQRDLAQQDGVWITYHVRPKAPTQRQLEAFAANRQERVLTNEASFGGTDYVNVAGRKALRKKFQYSSVDRLTGSLAMEGQHLFIPVGWGIVEVCVQLPSAAQDDWNAASEMLADLELHAPHTRRDPTQSFTRDAASVIGTWKADRGRMKFSGNGRVILEYDGRRRQQLDLETAQLVSPPRKLAGSYEAQEDLLLVTWEDGSRLNLRWQVANGELLLTDHQGRISQLKRLLE